MFTNNHAGTAVSPIITLAEIAEHRARHLRQTRELVELGLTLARAAAARANRALAAQAEASHSRPDLAASRSPAAKAENALHLLTNVVREAIILENRLAASAATAARPRKKTGTRRAPPGQAARTAAACRSGRGEPGVDPRVVPQLAFVIDLHDNVRLPDVVTAVRKRLSTETDRTSRAAVASAGATLPAVQDES